MVHVGVCRLWVCEGVSMGGVSMGWPTSIDKETDNLFPAEASGHDEWRRAVRASGLEVGAAAKQQLDHLRVD